MEVGENRVRVFYGTEKREGERLEIYTRGISPCSSNRVSDLVESKRERMKKLNCLSIQEKENTRLIYREKTILGEAEYHNRSLKPSTSAGARPPPRYGAGEAHGGYKPPA